MFGCGGHPARFLVIRFQASTPRGRFDAPVFERVELITARTPLPASRGRRSSTDLGRQFIR